MNPPQEISPLFPGPIVRHSGRKPKYPFIYLNLGEHFIAENDNPTSFRKYALKVARKYGIILKIEHLAFGFIKVTRLDPDNQAHFQAPPTHPDP